MRTPCSQIGPDRHPDDWFIAKDGQQYPDVPLMSRLEIARLRLSVLRKADESDEEHEKRRRNAVRTVVADRLREARGRRRRAREACRSECPVRLECYKIAEGSARGVIEHGTWGGFYEEERRALRRARDRRRSGRDGTE